MNERPPRRYNRNHAYLVIGLFMLISFIAALWVARVCAINVYVWPHIRLYCPAHEAWTWLIDGGWQGWLSIALAAALYIGAIVGVLRD